MTNNLAIIPARGGSKRIPRKNIKDFLGKPILAYSIEAALKSNLFQEVMVSTEDEEIAKIAKASGAVVPFLRSLQASDDYATLSDVIEEVKDCYLERGRSFENICCLLPTAPFISIADLKISYSMMLEQKADSVRPVVRFAYPIQRALGMNDGKLDMMWPEHKRTRSQDLEPAYHDAGQFYWMKFEKGLKGDDKLGFEINEIQAQDIDTFEDWKLAELKYNLLVHRKNDSPN